MAKLNPVDASTPETKKPHPFSKEGRALREAKLQEPQKEPVVKTEKAPVKETKSEKQPDLSQIMEKLEKLEAENKEFKDSMIHPAKKGHEINNDPKQFSYKMRGGVPVISWTTFKKDPTKDLVFKNEFGAYVSNHYLKLNLVNGETIDVEVNEFGIHHTKSEKMIARDHHQELIDNETLSRVKTLTFDTEERGKFTIDLAFIN